MVISFAIIKKCTKWIPPNYMLWNRWQVKSVERNINTWLMGVLRTALGEKSSFCHLSWCGERLWWNSSSSLRIAQPSCFILTPASPEPVFSLVNRVEGAPQGRNPLQIWASSQQLRFWSWTSWPPERTSQSVRASFLLFWILLHLVHKQSLFITALEYYKHPHSHWTLWTQFLFHLSSCEHQGFLVPTLAPKSSDVERVPPSFPLRCPHDHHSSPILFCSGPHNQFMRNPVTQRSSTWNLKQDLPVVCNHVIKALGTYCFAGLNTWHSGMGIDSGNILILNLKGLSCWSPRNAQATRGTGDNQCSKGALEQNSDLQLREDDRCWVACLPGSLWVPECFLPDGIKCCSNAGYYQM